MPGNPYEPKTYEYTTYPRQFVSYRWYKPLLTAFLAIIIAFAMMMVVFALAFMTADTLDFIDYISSITADFSTMDMYSLSGALMTWGSIACILPAMAIANRIVYDRPFASMASSRGGWNWSAFFKCLGLAALVMGVPMVLQSVFFPLGLSDHVIRFTLPGVIAGVLLLPVQCVAEEYMCRGFLMQTFGSWFRLPPLAIILQAAVFTSLHMYDIYGMTSIAIMGLAMGIVTYITRGLEASSACHITNNMVILFISGLGIEGASNETGLISLIFAAVIDIAYAVLVVIIGTRRNWFRPKADIVEKFNIKKLKKAYYMDNDEELPLPYPPEEEKYER